MEIFSVIFGKLTWSAMPPPKPGDCANCRGPRSKTSTCWRRERPEIFRFNICKTPSTTCSRSLICGRYCRLGRFTGCSLCDVPRRASYSIELALANNVGRKWRDIWYRSKLYGFTYLGKRRNFDSIWTQAPWRSWRDDAQNSRSRMNGYFRETSRTSSPLSQSIEHSLYYYVFKRSTILYYLFTPFSKISKFSSHISKLWRDYFSPSTEHQYSRNSINCITGKRLDRCRPQKPLTAEEKKNQATQPTKTPIDSCDYTHYVISLR